MKKNLYIIVALISSFIFTNCENIDFLNLKRDNPLDGKNNTNIQNGIALKFNSYYVYSDNNKDYIINKGENVKLNISLQNSGSKTAKAVNAKFSTSSPYISGLTPTSPVGYGDIEPGWIVWSGISQYASYAIQFTISKSTPENTSIPISINLTDGDGNTWDISFSVIVEPTKANITYENYYVYSDDNKNYIVNKGENVKLNIGLRNIGLSAAKKVNSTFSTTSPYVSGFTPTSQVNYGDIEPGWTVWSGISQYASYAIQFTVAESTPTNTKIPINISIIDESNNTWVSSFNITVE